ncbi:MAG: GNAT family N-acetyltransferase, partial [Rhodoferax sp.]|nr:GNAT family N-acetyltransferase [Rhodoferax sp.]
GQGCGTELMAFAEKRIFRDHANVFLCVSGFNAAARRFYRRLGYVEVGELTDFLVVGQSEWLMRKTRGPISSLQR